MWTKSLLFAVASITVSAAATTASAQYANDQYNTAATPQYTPNNAPAAAAPQLAQQQGRFFRFAMPAGWAVDEVPNGLHLAAPDGSGSLQHLGFIGLDAMSAQDFAYQELSKVLPKLQFVSGQQIQPKAGFTDGIVAEIAWTTNGQPGRGFVVAYSLVSGRQCNAVLTVVGAPAEKWEANRAMLTQMAMSVTAGGSGDTYSANNFYQQKRRNENAYAQQLSDYRNWSQNLQQQTTQQRMDSNDRRSWEFRQALGNETQYYNQSNGRLENYSSNNTVYWVNPYTGQVVGDPNSTYDPRTATDNNWERMQQQGWQR